MLTEALGYRPIVQPCCPHPLVESSSNSLHCEQLRSTARSSRGSTQSTPQPRVAGIAGQDIEVDVCFLACSCSSIDQDLCLATIVKEFLTQCRLSGLRALDGNVNAAGDGCKINIVDIFHLRILQGRNS